MARKIIEKTVSKGERLGWTPLDQVKSVTLTSVIVEGKRVKPERRFKATAQAMQSPTSFLIP